jgi:hypothetical protein
LLGNDNETRKYTTAAAKNCSANKHVSMNATTAWQQMDIITEAAFSMRSVPNSYKDKTAIARE